MIIERRDDAMHTKGRLGASPTAAAVSVGEGLTTMSNEIDFRMRRLLIEAERERLAGRREGVRQHLGHALMALGRAIHGIEVEHPARPALDAG
ncbi:MAG TPA: hypothetical protein VLM76_01675 [Patescibacteria group bacterium]|nr:hypothetical protein [Patescibacteria group bacterium]